METDHSNKIALFAGYLFDKKNVSVYLENLHGNTVCVFLDTDMDHDIPGIKSCVRTEPEKQELCASLKEFDSLLLITPPLKLLREIAEGSSASFAAEIFTRALLWGRDVVLLLDFVPAAYKRDTLFGKIADDLETLTLMGVHIETLPDKEKAQDRGYDLITEDDIKATVKQHKTTLLLNARGIVTPLAKDTAREMNIIIESIKE
jgi:hypothetical protein